MLTDLITRPCTIRRRSATGPDDAFGNPTNDVAETPALCELQQRARPETTDAGTVAQTEWALFMLADVELDTGDAVVVDGLEYEVAGEPARLRNPRSGVVEHIEATLVRTGGAQ